MLVNTTMLPAPNIANSTHGIWWCFTEVIFILVAALQTWFWDCCAWRTAGTWESEYSEVCSEPRCRGAQQSPRRFSAAPRRHPVNKSTVPHRIKLPHLTHSRKSNEIRLLIHISNHFKKQQSPVASLETVNKFIIYWNSKSKYLAQPQRNPF